ncbi:MAG: disulfide bond formation protein B [bacterium]|jgi:disulfide bond formation protein DsbB|nr:disulfide bond formation protein B [Betaproteobacteria bacterium]
MIGRHGRNDWNDRRGRAIFATPGGGWTDRWLSPRRAFGSAAFACFCLVAFALYLQYVQEEEPCPLCILQRVALIGMGVVFLVAALHAPRGAFLRVYGTLAALIGVAGAAVAARHVWLQNLPKDRVPECGPGLEFMLEQFPLSQVFALVLRGSGECAEASWRFLGLTIPGWTLLWFVGLVVLSLVVGWRPARRREDGF